MDAPRCRLCHTRHWSGQGCSATGSVIDQIDVDRRRLETARDVLRQAESVTKNTVDSVTINRPNVTINPPVTVTPPPISVTSKRGRPRSDNPMTTAERMRLYRARKKARAG